MLGAGASVVGRSRYCDHPREVEQIPQVGGFTDPNLEAILALRPELVTGARGPAGPSLTQKLEAHGIPTFFPPTESLLEIEEMIRQLGERTEHRAEAARWRENYLQKREQIEERLRSRPAPRVLLLYGIAPLVAAGPGSFADEMLRLARATNALEKSGATAYPTLSMEQVITLDPEYILDAAAMEQRTIPTDGVWSAVRAAREGRVKPLRSMTVLRPGPRVLEGVIELARALHPEVELP